MYCVSRFSIYCAIYHYGLSSHEVSKHVRSLPKGDLLRLGAGGLLGLSSGLSACVEAAGLEVVLELAEA